MAKQVKTLQDLAIILNQYDIHINDLIKLANSNHWSINISNNNVRINDDKYYIDFELDVEEGTVVRRYEDRDDQDPSRTTIYHILILCNPFN